MLLGLTALGVDPGAVLARVGSSIETLEDLPDRLAPGTLRDLWTAVVAVTGRRGLGVELAQRIRLESYDVFGFVVGTSATLGDALLKGVRLFGLVSETVRIEVELDAARTTTSLVPYQPGHLHPESTEFLVGAALAIGRQIVRGPLVPLAVRFTHDPPDDAGYLERHLGVRPEFHASTTSWSVDTALLSMPLIGHDRERHAEVAGQAESLLLEAAGAREVQRQVLDVVAVCLPDGEPGIDRVAAMLGVHPKALARRLVASGTSYRDLVVRYRMRLAERYLARPGMSVAEVAFQLGYAEKSAFNRAYRRWTGRAPRGGT